jgi:hypothetical protein
MAETKHEVKPSKLAMVAAKRVLDVMLPEPFRTETEAIPGTLEDMAKEIDAAYGNSHALLVDALEAVDAKGCNCRSTHEPDWHSDKCVIPKVRAALQAAKQGEKIGEK